MIRFRVISLLLLTIPVVLAQTQTQIIGEITAIDSQSRVLSLRTDKAETVAVHVTDTTLFRRVPAGAQDLTKAVRIAFADVGKGIGSLPSGRGPAIRRSMRAR